MRKLTIQWTNGKTLLERFGKHRRDITNKQTVKSGVAEHFNRRHHSLTDASFIPLQTINPSYTTKVFPR